MTLPADPNRSRYRLLRAASEAHFHTCFYCGCIATESDFAPPQDHWGAYANHNQSADNLQVPSCKECLTLLKGCTMALVQQRRDVVHAKLARKYQKAINVYLRWSEDELAELDFSLRHSIDAGLQLGQEAHRRCNYPGFPYDVDGTVYPIEELKPQSIVVFGERFEGLKAALVHASKTYGISQGKLAQGLEQHDNNLEAVILSAQRQQQAATSERELNRACGAFAKEHGQSRRYVVNAVKRYMERDEELSVYGALEKLYQERVRHF